MVTVTVVALILSIVSLVIALIALWHRSSPREFPRQTLKKQLGGLLSEFNAAASSKVKLLEERIEELRTLHQKAESAAETLSELVERAEDSESALPSGNEPLRSGPDEPQFRMDRVLSLARDGYTPSEIAEKTDFKPGEVSVILRLHHSGSPSS